MIYLIKTDYIDGTLLKIGYTEDKNKEKTLQGVFRTFPKQVEKTPKWAAPSNIVSECGMFERYALGTRGIGSAPPPLPSLLSPRTAGASHLEASPPSPWTRPASQRRRRRVPTAIRTLQSWDRYLYWPCFCFGDS